MIATDKGSFFVQDNPGPSLAQHVKAFCSVDETSKWEALLESEPQNFYLSVKLALEQAFKALSALPLTPYNKPATPPIGHCPHCHSPIRAAEYSYMCTSTNGCKFVIARIFKGHKWTEKEIIQLLSGSFTRLADFNSDKYPGTKFKAKVKYDPTLRHFQFQYVNAAAPGGRT